MKALLNNKNVISLVMAIVTYSSICLKRIVEPFSVTSWLVLLCLILLYSKIDILNKKYKKDIIIISLLLSFLIVFGKIVNDNLYTKDTSVFNILIKPTNILLIIGIFNLLYVLLIDTLPKLINFEIKKENQENNKGLKVFLISFIIILLFWIPYFLTFFPGLLSSDALGQLGWILNDFKGISDHHPVAHTLYVSIPYNIGYMIFGKISAGVACFSIFQMIIMSAIFSYLVYFLYKRNINKYILLVVVSFYALLPVHAFYSITMWKDVIFGGLILLLTIETIKLLEKRNELKAKDLTIFVIESILCNAFRNNSIYMYYLFAIATIIIFRKKIKIILPALLIVFSTYYIIKFPVLNYFNITRSSSSEYIAMPLQQIGRMAYKDVEFTKEEKELIDKIMPLEKLKEAYNPVTSDGIKFNKAYNRKEFDNNKEKYFNLWLNLVIKHPSVALESYAVSTLGYWYPGVNFWAVYDGIDINDYGLETNSKAPKVINYLVNKMDSKDIPVLNMEWSIGLIFWTISLFGYIAIKRNKRILLYSFLPIMGIWLTMMIASPVYSEYRYVYCAFTTLPLLIVLPYLKENSKKVN